MDNTSKILICGEEYSVCDVLSGNAIEDCSVCKAHKIGNGHGERKIYLPGNVEEKFKFFNGFNIDIKGFLLKSDLVAYLMAAKKEFNNPQQDYREKDLLKKEYKKLCDRVAALAEIIPLSIKKSNVTHSGLYINQNSGKKADANWNLIGDIALPRISKLSILKLRKDDEIRYYFKLSFGMAEADEKDAFDYEDEIEKIKESKLKPAEKECIILARVGQGTYRKKLLEESCVCPFTLVDDEHLLIASHIKPWKKSTYYEKKDPKNGFVFTPTYDKLFDRGYISFNDDKTLIVSPWLSEYNREKLNIYDGMMIELLPVIDGKRAKYLCYHREHVMKKLEDL